MLRTSPPINTLNFVTFQVSIFLHIFFSSLSIPLCSSLVLVFAMALIKFLFISFFLLVLIFSQDAAFVEGRPLIKFSNREISSNTNEDETSRAIPSDNMMSSRRDLQRENEHGNLSDHVEDFRPTTPGHSPGIGH